MQAQFANGKATRMIEQAKIHARRALELRKEHYGEKHELVAKDLFYLVSSDVPMKQSTPELLAEAIEMMRETNRENLNLGHMLIAYANRLFIVGTADEKAEYLKFARDRKDSDAIKLAENYYREALTVFQKHHKDDHVSIIGVNCRLGQVMVEEGRLSELGRYYSSCRNLPDTLAPSQAIKLTEIADQIEKAMKRDGPDS